MLVLLASERKGVMGKIKEQSVGTCTECGEETGIDSPVVCFGCAQQVTQAAEGVFVTDDGRRVEGLVNTDKEVPF